MSLPGTPHSPESRTVFEADNARPHRDLRVSKSMDMRRWVITAVLGLLALACAAAAVSATSSRADADDRHDSAEQELSATTADLQEVQAESEAQQEAQSALDSRAERLAALFTPDVLASVLQVQADTVSAACSSARTATRDAAELPTGRAVVDYAIAAGPSTESDLDGLSDRWGRMLDATAVQAEIDRCAADEQAIIDAEAAAAAAEQRFCGVPLFPEDYCPTQAEIDAENDYEGLVDDCAGGDPAACAAIGYVPPEPHFGAIGPLVDACYAGDQAACDELRNMGVPGF